VAKTSPAAQTINSAKEESQMAMLRLAECCRRLMHLLGECFLSNEDAIEASGMLVNPRCDPLDDTDDQEFASATGVGTERNPKTGGKTAPILPLSCAVSAAGGTFAD
jgi:hypothetical protein